MIDLLKKNNKIIVNTDIDGILSALLLHKYVGCEVAGFSNSNDKVWLDKNKARSIYDCVYVDMFVPREDVGCIDQHIISANSDHHQVLAKNPNKFNPNLDNPRYHLPNDSYYLKYPFGSVHYIIGHLERVGIKVELDLYNKIGELNLIDLILRADDAMQTTVASNYVKNAADWWKWLSAFSNNGKMTEGLIMYLYHTLNKVMVDNKKMNTTKLFTGSPFCCSSPDGGYKAITDADHNLQGNVKTYIKFLADLSGLDCFDLEMKLDIYNGRPIRTTLTDVLRNELINHLTINGQQVFSYAFVRSNNRDANFSYTIM